MKKSNRKRRKYSNRLSYENLEVRKMLAGDIGPVNAINFDSPQSAQLVAQSQLITGPIDSIDMTSEDWQNDLHQFLGLGEHDSLELSQVQNDESGYTRFKFHYFFDGSQLENIAYTVHAKNNLVETISGNFVDHDLAPVDFTLLGPKEAFQNAQSHDSLPLDRSSDLFHDYEVLFSNFESDTWSLVYKFEMNDHSTTYVDGQTGTLIGSRSNIHHGDVPASGTSHYDGTVDFVADMVEEGLYRLRQSEDGVSTYDFKTSEDPNDAVDISNSSNNFDDASFKSAVQAHYGAEQSIGYFENEFNRSDGPINVGVNYGSNEANAYYDNGLIVFGEGDGDKTESWTSLDIVGHEYSHAVTEYSAGLVYELESGALNESFSDIFGEMIENYARGANDWLIASEIGVSPDYFLRSFIDPSSEELPEAKRQPDTYDGDYWFDTSSCESLHGCGVHINSGVQNKWFYILANGESGVNDNGYSYDVSGVGLEAAAEIAYLTLATYMTPTSNYFNAREFSIQAAIELSEPNSPLHFAVMDAWEAVGVSAAVGFFGGPWTVQEGGEVEVEAFVVGTAGSNFEYWWDLDGDNVFGETSELGTRGYERGKKTTLKTTRNDDGPGTFDIRVKLVSSDFASTDPISDTITVENAPPFGFINGPSEAFAGQAVTFQAIVSDYSVPDAAALDSSEWIWQIRGATDTFDGTGSTITFVPTVQEKLDVSITFQDKDGGEATITRVVNLNTDDALVRLDERVAGELVGSNDYDLYAIEGEAGRTITVSAYWGALRDAGDGALDSEGRFRLIGPDGEVLAAPSLLSTGNSYYRYYYSKLYEFETTDRWHLLCRSVPN